MVLISVLGTLVRTERRGTDKQTYRIIDIATHGLNRARGWWSEIITLDKRL